MDRSDMMHVMYDKKGPKVAENFAKRGFEAYYCPTKEEALQKALALIPADHVVSWGGSVSINEIGLRPYVLEHYQVIDRDAAASPEERVELMRKALLCDTFIMGTNAATEDGQLYNIDGNGNRVAALVYGPKQVVVIVGMNKVAPTLEDAVVRARTVAAPINKQRFAAPTPCIVTGMCADCNSEGSICNQFVRTRRCSPAGRIKIILVGENLGF
ncbi:lactate utilization protein [uncultured Megasphaera sp.]|uniref:lactate utilization protein n=1 Tax=uncultured Megasphaera sp. TaxID=165188 RepID=UPI00261D4CD9|nr:lactate utilization protein [uncultured Megasphaera sp.]